MRKAYDMRFHPPDELLNAQQVSAELQGLITARTVTNWCRAGKVKAIRAGVGGKWLIRRGDLKALLDQQGGDEGEIMGKAEALAA